MIIHGLMSEPELEPLSKMLGGLISEGEEARQLGVWERKVEGVSRGHDEKRRKTGRTNCTA